MLQTLVLKVSLKQSCIVYLLYIGVRGCWSRVGVHQNYSKQGFWGNMWPQIKILQKDDPHYFLKIMGVVFLQFFDLMASLAFFCQFLYFVSQSTGILRQCAPSNRNFVERRPILFFKNNGGHLSSKFCFYGVLIPFWSILIFYQSIRWPLEAMDGLKSKFCRKTTPIIFWK